MSKESLKAHYERKYAHENAGNSIEPVAITDIPTSRFEACVKFFPAYFTSGEILEIGAGNGNVAKTLLSKDIKISRYILGDISLPRLEGLRRNLDDGRVRIMELDGDDLAGRELGQYDAVILIALIEHLIDPLRAMQEIRKLLKPGGFVYIDTPNLAKYTRRLKLLFGRFPSTGSANEGLTTYAGQPADLYDEGHLHYFTYRSLSLMLTEGCGFSRIVKLGYATGAMPLGKRVHTLLAKRMPELFSELAIIAYA